LQVYRVRLRCKGHKDPVQTHTTSQHTQTKTDYTCSVRAETHCTSQPFKQWYVTHTSIHTHILTRTHILSRSPSLHLLFLLLLRAATITVTKVGGHVAISGLLLLSRSCGHASFGGSLTKQLHPLNLILLLIDLATVHHLHVNKNRYVCVYGGGCIRLSKMHRPSKYINRKKASSKHRKTE